MKLHQLLKSMHVDKITVQAVFQRQHVKFKVNELTGQLMWDYSGSWTDCNLIYNHLNQLDFRKSL